SLGYLNEKLHLPFLDIMNRKKVWITGSCVIVGTFMIFAFWSFYTLGKFDTIVPPYYLIGLSDPDKYYQEHISDYMKKNGSQVNNEKINTAGLSEHKNGKCNFSFKYPSDVGVVDDKGCESILTLKEEAEDKCRISVLRDLGWMVNLPRMRMQSRNGYDHYVLMDERAFRISNISNKEDIEENDFVKGLSILFFEDGEAVSVKFKGKCDYSVFDSMVGTIEF
ncbi:hypothetical protein ACFL08_05985, partial [Patescibacteria group bacterium]